VKRHNGELVHHAGGVEEPAGPLAEAVSTAAAIVCRLDALSHDAVRDLCERYTKPCVPLRSSVPSAFARALEEAAA
jgi:hypothetical protein